MLRTFQRPCATAHIPFTHSARTAVRSFIGVVAAATALTHTPVRAEGPSDSTADERPILEELRVTASRLPTPPAGVQVRLLNAADPAFTTQNDLGTALQGQAGITYTNTGGPGKVSALRIRGEEASRTLVLVDGIELADVSAPQVTTNIHHLVLDPGITGVDVLAGPQAFFLGGDAGGVVNIKTTTPEAGHSARVVAEAGSDDHMKLSALGTVGTQRGGVSVSAQKWRTAGFNAREDDTTLADRDGYDNVTLHARGHWQFSDRAVVELVVRDVDAETDFDNCGFPRSDDCVEDYEQTSVRLGGTFEGQRLSHRLSASLSEVDRSNFAGGAFSFGAEGDLNKYEYSFSGQANNWDFSGGAELREEEINDRERDQWGVYGETGVVLSNGFQAGFGLRLDDNDDFGTHVTGRVHSSWTQALDQGQTVRVRASYGTGFRAPSLSEEAYNNGPFAFPPASTTELNEEQSAGIDLGVTLDAPTYSAALTLFSQEIEDEILFDLSTFAGFIQSSGTTKSRGVTLSGQINLTDSFTVSGDYMYNRAKLADGRDRLRRPRNSGRLSLQFNRDRLALGTTARFVGEVDDEVFGVGRSELDDYVVVDLVASYRALEGLEVFGRVTNLFSANARDVVGFRSDGTGVFGGIRWQLDKRR